MIEGIKTSEFILLAVVIVLGYAFGAASESLGIVAAGSAIGAGLYGLGRGIAKKGGS